MRRCKQCRCELTARGQRGYCSPKCYYEKVKSNRPACPICGTPRQRHLNTCSSGCGYIFRKEKLRRQKPCPVCGVEFWPRTQGQRASHRYCSRKCYLERVSERKALIECECPQCKSKFKRTNGAVKRSTRTFCSRKCTQEFYVGENSSMFRGDKDPNRGAAWNRRAEAIRMRDGYKCRRCDKTQEENKQKLSVDHIIPWRWFKEDEKDDANNETNLASLCRKCHSWKTVVAERAYLRGDQMEFLNYIRALKATAPIAA